MNLGPAEANEGHTESLSEDCPQAHQTVPVKSTTAAADLIVRKTARSPRPDSASSTNLPSLLETVFATALPSTPIPQQTLR